MWQMACLSLLRGGWSWWVGVDARWDHAVHHTGLWQYLFLGPLPSLFASPHFRMWIESGCLQLQTEAEFNAGIEQVWGKGRVRRDPKATWCNYLLCFPFYNFWLGWEKWEINSLTSALRTIPECLLIRDLVIPHVFSEHLWTIAREMHPHSKSFCPLCCF